LVAGHHTDAPYRVIRPLDAQDTRATGHGLAAFGTRLHREDSVWGLRPGRIGTTANVRCGASGTTLRLLTGIAALAPAPTRFSGTRRLGQRPLEPLLDALRTHGAAIRHPTGATLPLTITGPLLPGAYRVGGSESSQFVSSLLFTLPRLEGTSTLVVTGSLVSAPYVEATLAVLRAHHIKIAGSFGRWRVPGAQRYSSTSFRVPGDASSAAYLWAAGVTSGGSVTVRGVAREWPQADLAILPILRSAGASVHASGDAVTASGRLERPFQAELTPCPDLYPLVGALAAVIPGESLLRGAPQIVGKESDRRAATIDLVRRLGGHARLTSKGLSIRWVRQPSPVRSGRWDDHRLVMSAAVVGLATGKTARLGDPAAVRKSYPGFWSALSQLGIPLRRTR
jgi:3-phosphoshikimate 1-carboxyvinyltransferase